LAGCCCCSPWNRQCKRKMVVKITFLAISIETFLTCRPVWDLHMAISKMDVSTNLTEILHSSFILLLEMCWKLLISFLLIQQMLPIVVLATIRDVNRFSRLLITSARLYIHGTLLDLVSPMPNSRWRKALTRSEYSREISSYF
jgi:hypothetical protein